MFHRILWAPGVFDFSWDIFVQVYNLLVPALGAGIFLAFMSADGRANVAAGMNGRPGDVSRSRLFFGGGHGGAQNHPNIS